MKKKIVEILKKIIPLKESEILNLIEVPSLSNLGDFAFPCFSLSKQMKKNPNQIAQELKAKIKLPKEIEKIEVNGAYLNFFINKKIFAEEILKKILEEKKDFGKTNVGQEKKSLIEHTSINPNASPHVGRARNALIGDSLARILNFLNFKTEVHYYVNDVSKQIAMLVLSDAENLKFSSMLDRYVEISKKVKDSKELEKKVFELLKKFEGGDEKTIKKFRKIVKICVKGQEKILSEIGIKYDFFDYESDYIKNSNEIINKLKKAGKIFRDDDGRIVLDLKGTSIDGQMKSPVLVLTRSDGTGLYPLRDISYTLEKLKKSKENLVVLGEDQKLYFQQIKQALKFLGSDSPNVVHYSYILLSKKGISKKMSTRKGNIVLLENFLKDIVEKAKKEIEKRKTKGDAKKVGIASIKYSILKNNNNKIINFNLEEALNFEGDTGPYLLYSYARANSILKKTKLKNKKFEIENIEPIEFELVKKFSQFPEVVLSAYKNFNPSLIANYSYHLAQTFNEFYHLCPVLNSENEIFRLKLVEAFKIVLKNSLNLLGIETIEEM